MKQKPRWTLEMLTASLAVLCGLLVLVLLVQRPDGVAGAAGTGGAVGRLHGGVPLPAAPVDGTVDERHGV